MDVATPMPAAATAESRSVGAIGIGSRIAVGTGVSMLVAAARRSGGCEVTAVANAVLGRDDQAGCVLFGPIDAAEGDRRVAQS